MSEVFKLGIASKNNQAINEVSSIDVLANKGIKGDRHFKEFNDSYNQISLIESENIDYYNNKYKTKISYVDFRRNIITEGIELNNLIKKKMEIGLVKIFPYELCRPCLHLEQMVNGNDIVKEFLLKGGLRCEVLVSGKIKIGDTIRIL